jgi:hypothetical protein
MMSKEEILDKNYERGMHWKSVNRGKVLNVMEEYAKQECIEFGDWLRENDYLPADKSAISTWVQFGSKIGWLQPGMSIIKTTEQVYKSYLFDKFLHDNFIWVEEQGFWYNKEKQHEGAEPFTEKEIYNSYILQSKQT